MARPNSIETSQSQFDQINTWRDRVIQFLDEPNSLMARLTQVGLLTLIYASVVLLVVEYRFPALASEQPELVTGINTLILAIFGAELLVRVTCYRKPLQYLSSRWGIIDLLAVVPGLVALLVPLAPNMAWVRTLRVLRFMRMLKFFRASRGSSGVLSGITKRVLPYIILGISAKGVLVAFEGKPWWPSLAGDLTIVIAVTGFAIGILLGTKLNMVQNRFHDIEDAMARITGSLRDIKHDNTEVAELIPKWAETFERILHETSEVGIQNLKRQTIKLEAALERAGIGGPVTAGFHRDVEFALHRIRRPTPYAYERFLRYVTVIYSTVVVLAIPDLTGFFSTALVIYVLGGLYLMIDDMDRPTDHSEESLIAIDLTPIREFNQLQRDIVK